MFGEGGKGRGRVIRDRVNKKERTSLHVPTLDEPMGSLAIGHSCSGQTFVGIMG